MLVCLIYAGTSINFFLYFHFRAGSKYSCNICRKVMTSQEQLNVHLKGAWHAMQVKTMEKSTAKALRGAWASWTHPKHSGWYS